MKNDHRSKFSNLSNWKEEAWKNQGFNGIRTRDLCDTGAMLYQLSYEATHWERGQFIEFISPVRSEMIYFTSLIFHPFLSIFISIMVTLAFLFELWTFFEYWNIKLHTFSLTSKKKMLDSYFNLKLCNKQLNRKYWIKYLGIFWLTVILTGKKSNL